MHKRQRETDSKSEKSPHKIRKLTPDVRKKNYHDAIDLTIDSGESFTSTDSVIDITDNNENSPKKSKQMFSNNINKERLKKDEININDYIDVNDSALMNELFSQFTDSEDDESQLKVLTNEDEKLKTFDSGFRSIGPTQTSCSQEETIVGPSKYQLKSEESHHDDIDELFDDDWDGASKYCLDLSNFKRCDIIGIEKKRTSLYVTLGDPNPESDATALLICSGTWMDLRIEVGESMVVKAKKSFGNWVVNNEWGFCITQPDILIAGTSVTSGVFCARKGVLQQRFVGINCLPNLEPTDAAMTCGTIVHEIMQKALQQKIYELAGIRGLFEKILKEPWIIQRLYASSLSVDDIKKMADEYLKKIHEFIQRYIKGIPQKTTAPPGPNTVENFKGRITDIRDIEENVWLPDLGIKGKIDVTVEVKINNRKKIMPLEIKTGRTTFSYEHKGQLYLYVMMLKMLGYEVDSGLLLYIKDNQMQEIKSTMNEQRGLIALRNLMAYYLSKPCVTIGNSGALDPKSWELMELPEPIYHPQACRNCAYNTLCCVYADSDKNLFLSDHHPIADLSKVIVPELTDDHVNYVMNWIGMIELEDAQVKQADSIKNVWSMKPADREKKRKCLSFMEIVQVVQDKTRFNHQFVKSEKAEFSVKDFNEVFAEGDSVFISTSARVNICNGWVKVVAKELIVVATEKDVTRWINGEVYHIDPYALRPAVSRNFATIATLLTPNDITRRMRRIIIDKEPARFTNELPKSLESPAAVKIMGRLNKYQREALEAVIKANDYVLIKGMPGTGKTETLVALIELIVLLDKSVIVTAHTHIAVDNILLKLNERNVDFLRLGNIDRVHPDLLHKADSQVIKDCDTPEKLANVYNKQKVIGVTCLGAAHVLLSKRIFDFCLVDECTQILQPIILRPLYSAFTFVFVGDPEQLPAVVQSNEARKLGMAEDIFTRLDSPNNTRVLRLQYRMNQTIMDLANEYTYKGELREGNGSVANATLKARHPEILENCEEWMRKALSTSLDDAVTVLDTGETFSLTEHKNLENLANPIDKENEKFPCRYSNWYEVSLVQRLINTLVKSGVDTQDIGVIAPFRAQINLLRLTIKHDIEINTVDQYQGRDKSVIVFSCTKSNRAESKNITEYRILEDHKRLNVAITRAKHKIIIIGDVKLLMEFSEPTKELVSILKDKIVHLKQGIDDFSWKNLLSELPILPDVDVKDED